MAGNSSTDILGWCQMEEGVWRGGCVLLCLHRFFLAWESFTADPLGCQSRTVVLFPLALDSQGKGKEGTYSNTFSNDSCLSRVHLSVDLKAGKALLSLQSDYIKKQTNKKHRRIHQTQDFEVQSVSQFTS